MNHLFFSVSRLVWYVLLVCRFCYNRSTGRGAFDFSGAASQRSAGSETTAGFGVRWSKVPAHLAVILPSKFDCLGPKSQLGHAKHAAGGQIRAKKSGIDYASCKSLEREFLLACQNIIIWSLVHNIKQLSLQISGWQYPASVESAGIPGEPAGGDIQFRGDGICCLAKVQVIICIQEGSSLGTPAAPTSEFAVEKRRLPENPVSDKSHLRAAARQW
ncbi:hypothetical protein AYI70_g142 [Smittium culicis]|uniref:Uncharacterized protein n=1 Tax=Smittium culicis TaxID=133412 RepID=A0A1R1YHT4_9FUNG|nr:hypothetical protein AYI70_g142 [Smittium culicis]